MVGRGMLSRSFSRAQLLILASVTVAIMALMVWDAPTASGLANPLLAGSNIAMNAPNNVPKVIPAAGTNCSVTIQMELSDAGPGGGCRNTPICSGYSPTGGPVLTKATCIMPVCADPLKCVAPWVTRDTTPGVIWVMALDAPTDGGCPFRVERGAGCQGP